MSVHDHDNIQTFSPRIPKEGYKDIENIEFFSNREKLRFIKNQKAKDECLNSKHQWKLTQSRNPHLKAIKADTAK